MAPTPPAPYYAVIFCSILQGDDPEYAQTATRMVELAQEQPGFLGIESVRDQLGITISYWDSLKAIQKWKKQSEHHQAQQRRKKDWYEQYKIRIAYIERDYDWALAE
ncbi:MAG: antibiotic biosynthesis monooxygenase [Bacteroidota bacterium]